MATGLEVLAHLVVAAVFKTVEPYVNRAVGGFDSHALPPFLCAVGRTLWHHEASPRQAPRLDDRRPALLANRCDWVRAPAAPDYAPLVRRFLHRL